MFTIATNFFDEDLFYSELNVFENGKEGYLKIYQPNHIFLHFFLYLGVFIFSEIV